MKILVDAFVEKNLGDDLFLKILFERYSSNVQWYVTCNSNDALFAFKGYSNVIRYDKKIHAHKDFDAVINIGGSIFYQSGYWWIRQLLMRLRYAIPMKLKKKPIFIIGCNFGPCNSKMMYILNYLYIKYFVADISFRDMNSYNLFKKLKQSRHSPDIVYGLDLINIVKSKIRNKIGICVMYFEDERINEIFANKMAELTQKLLKKDYTVKFFSFFKKNNDAKEYMKIKEKLDETKKVGFTEYDGNINEFLGEFSSCNAMITLRFHSLVLAQIMKIQYYPISYSNKTINLLQDQKYPYDYCKIENISKLDIDQLIEQLNKPVYTVTFDRKPSNHFAKIDEFIKD